MGAIEEVARGIDAAMSERIRRELEGP